MKVDPSSKRAITWAGAWVLALAAALPASAQPSDVSVLTAWYGQTCNAAHGNVTAHVKSRCDGRRQCDYRVDAGTLGDPAPNCAKNFIVVYACAGQGPVRLAQLPAEAHGQIISLGCSAPQQPVMQPLPQAQPYPQRR